MYYFQAMMTRLRSHHCDLGKLLVKINIQSPDLVTRPTENGFLKDYNFLSFQTPFSVSLL
jgi:hypothetical protein